MPERAAEPATTAAPPSVLQPGARFEGLVALRAPARIDGSVRGEIVASDLLWLGETARVEARIAAPAIVIEGEFAGEAAATGRIELLETARVRAILDTQHLVLAEGSFFEGRCRTRRESAADAAARAGSRAQPIEPRSALKGGSKNGSGASSVR